MDINNRIKQLRIDKRFTQDELAAAIAVKRNHISDIERGIQRPPAETVRKIADVFGVDAAWILSGEGEMYAKADMVKEPAASYGVGILERIDSRDEEIKKTMDAMFAQITALTQTVKNLEKKLEAV